MKLDFTKVKEAFKRFLDKAANKLKTLLERFEKKEATPVPTPAPAAPVEPSSPPAEPVPTPVTPTAPVEPAKPVEQVKMNPPIAQMFGNFPLNYSGAWVGMAGPKGATFQTTVDVPSLVNTNTVMFTTQPGPNSNGYKLQSFTMSINGVTQTVNVGAPVTQDLTPGSSNPVSFQLDGPGSVVVGVRFADKK